MGNPPAIKGLEAQYRNPAFATALGLVLLAGDEALASGPVRRQPTARKEKISRVKRR